MLTRSFGLVVLMVVLLVVFFYRMLPDLLKIIRYKIKNKKAHKDFFAHSIEQPILELEYDSGKFFKGWILSILWLSLMAFGFFTAASGARHDSSELFFFLNERQTYLLYYCAWKFDSLFMFVWFGLYGIIAFSSKRVLFFKDYMISENRVTGLQKFDLNKNVRLVKNSGSYMLYDQQTGSKIAALDRKNMTFDASQEKSVEEYVRKIPVIKRYFFC